MKEVLAWPSGLKYHPATHTYLSPPFGCWLPAPGGYRPLEPGEIVLRGDKFFSSTTLQWITCSPIVPCTAAEYLSIVLRPVDSFKNEVVIE